MRWGLPSAAAAARPALAASPPRTRESPPSLHHRVPCPRVGRPAAGRSPRKAGPSSSQCSAAAGAAPGTAHPSMHSSSLPPSGTGALQQHTASICNFDHRETRYPPQHCTRTNCITVCLLPDSGLAFIMHIPARAQHCQHTSLCTPGGVCAQADPRQVPRGAGSAQRVPKSAGGLAAGGLRRGEHLRAPDASAASTCARARACGGSPPPPHSAASSAAWCPGPGRTPAACRV